MESVWIEFLTICPKKVYTEIVTKTGGRKRARNYGKRQQNGLTRFYQRRAEFTKYSQSGNGSFRVRVRKANQHALRKKSRKINLLGQILSEQADKLLIQSQVSWYSNAIS